MGKLCVTLSEETEKQLCDYVTKKHRKKSDDKLSEVVEAALKEYLERKDEHIGSTQTFY
jgi:hypothetical protein